MVVPMSTSEEPVVRTARQWLLDAAGEIGVDPARFDPVIGDILDLAKAVAHGPSRPGVPLTAFLLGLSFTEDASTEVIRQRIHHIRDLALSWKEEDVEAH